VRGTLDWLPPPAAWLWWFGAALLALAVLALGSRWPGSPRAIAPIAGLTTLGYAVSQALDGRPLPAVLLGVTLLALIAALFPGPLPVLLAGAALLVFGGFVEAGVFGAAVVAAAGPAWLARVAVLIALGAGAGMCATGLLRLRAATGGRSIVIA
jgi:hypothetical protein